MRVGIISLIHESNTFIHTPTVMDDFRREALLIGSEIADRWASAAHEIGGFFEGLQAAGAEAIPIMAAWAMPNGPVEAATYAELLQMMLDGLAESLPLDGLLLAPHGAGVSEEQPDMDGHWLSMVRQQMGPDIPIVATLDPHANLSPRMVDACDAMIAYRTNPHLDQRQVGLQAARLLVRTLRGEVTPTQAACFPPIAINIERQSTSDPPCRPMYEFANEMLDQPTVLSNSICLGFSFSDVEEMGTAFIVVTDGDRPLAQQHADDLGAYLHDHRQQFVAELIGIDDAIEKAIDAEKPVCLLDMGDNAGGGSPADSTFLAHSLHQLRVDKSFVCLYDPAAVQEAERAGVGQRVVLRMGGKTDHLHGDPLEAEVTIRGLHDGEYTESKVRHGGRSWGSLGRTAIVTTDSGLTLQLTSQRSAPFSIEPIRCCGLDPADFRILVAKGVIAPIAAYREVCKTFIRVSTPGCTSADLATFDYRHRRRPMFPFEDVG